MKRKILLGLALMAGANVWAQEEPVQRSSHPRGFASDASLPSMTSAGGKTHSGSATAAGPAAATGNQAGQQSATGGVNLIGNTRIDARVQGATSAAVGQQNDAGNRVGAIGGK